MAYTLDDFDNDLGNFGQELQNLTPLLTRIGNEMTAQLRSNAPVADSEGGSLQSSIQLSVQPTSFGISMLAYGVFQNYGVVGVDGGSRATDPRGGQRIPNEVFPQGSGDGGKYQFGVKQPKYRGWGAYYTGFSKNVGWFDVDELAEEVTDRLQEAINNLF